MYYPEILFDCERMRRPFTGKYAFCRELALRLADESKKHSCSFGLYLPEVAEPFCPELPHVGFKRFHKWVMPHDRNLKVFHSTTPLSRYYPKDRRVSIITTVHDLNYLHYEVSKKEFEWHDRRTLNAIRRSDRIVTISEDAKRDILAHYGDPGKPIDVIYNGLNTFSGDIQAPERIPEGKFLFSVCRITRSKNLHTLPALLEGNDYKLFIAGKDIKDGHLGQIFEEARRWGTADRLIYTGPVSEGVKHWYLQNCEAFLFPSLAEGFGLPVLEALQYGKPVFCSDRTSLPEIGGDLVFYFNHGFEPRAMQDEFRRGMDDFRRNPPGEERIKAHLAGFSWEKAAKEYFELYLKSL
jgi:glycosyltransferase involved in cell wall biosynthesis